MSKPKPSIDLSLYKIAVEDTDLYRSVLFKNKEYVNISLSQVWQEINDFSFIEMSNSRHIQEIGTMFPDYLIKQANVDDMKLFLSMSRFDSKNNTFIVGCFDNTAMDFKLISYKYKMLAGTKWRTRGSTSPNRTAFVRIYSEEDPIFVLEGHKDALTAILLGLNFIMLPYAGYRNPVPTDLQEEVRGRNVVFLVEDKPAFDCMHKLVRPFSETAESIVLKQLGPAGEKVDLSDYAQQFNSIKAVIDAL